MSNLKKNGYKIININKTKLTKLRKQTINLFKKIYKIKKKITLKDLAEHYIKKKKFWNEFYKLCNKQSLIYSILLDNKILEELKKYGYKNPGIIPENTGLRFDFPKIQRTRFAPHQDSPYNTGGLNSITVWIPLMETNKNIGSLRVYPNFKKKIVKHRIKDGKLVCDKLVANKKYYEKFTKFGQGIFMNQALIHASGNNLSNYPRITILGRFFDFYDKKFVNRFLN